MRLLCFRARLVPGGGDLLIAIEMLSVRRLPAPAFVESERLLLRFSTRDRKAVALLADYRLLFEFYGC